MMAASVMIVLPAYQARGTLAATLGEIPPELDADLLLVDDGSTDGTAALARRLGLEVIAHPTNRGYGANQKTCYGAALARGARCVVMLHPDHQYDARALPRLIAPILKGDADLALGSRFLSGGPLPKGMPPWRALGNLGLTALQNRLLGSDLSEFHTGLRAYSGALLRALPFAGYDEGFLFDQQLLVGALARGARIHEVPIQARYFPGASSISFSDALVYGVRTLQVSWDGRVGPRQG